MENTDVGVQDVLYNQEEVFNNRELLQTGFRFSSFPLNRMATERKEAAVAVEMDEKEAKKRWWGSKEGGEGKGNRVQQRKEVLQVNWDLDDCWILLDDQIWNKIIDSDWLFAFYCIMTESEYAINSPNGILHF